MCGKFVCLLSICMAAMANYIDDRSWCKMTNKEHQKWERVDGKCHGNGNGKNACAHGNHQLVHWAHLQWQSNAFIKFCHSRISF